jgi:hypothetical protein
MDTAKNPVSSKANLFCKCCNAAISDQDMYCSSCDFPLKATDDEQRSFIYQRGYKKEELKKLDARVGYASIVLYILGGLLLLNGLVTFFINAQNELIVISLLVYGVLSVSFICLGAWSTKKPIIAISCGLALYILLILLPFFTGITGLFGGIIGRLGVIGVLIWALVSASEAGSIKKQHNI